MRDPGGMLALPQSMDPRDEMSFYFLSHENFIHDLELQFVVDVPLVRMSSGHFLSKFVDSKSSQFGLPLSNVKCECWVNYLENIV